MSSEHRVYKTIKVETDGHVAVVTMSRPEAHNAWTDEMRRELIHAYQSLESYPKVRAIVLTGDPAGNVFCAGKDLRAGDFSDSSEDETKVEDGGGQFAQTVYRSRKVTIAAINGSAAGIGITQTLPMDLRFAWADAKIVFPFTRRGIVPEATSTHLLPRLLGQSRALAVFLLASPALTASAPLLAGLFAHLLPTKDAVLPYALRVAHELAAGTSPASVAYTKALVLHARGSVAEQRALDSRAMYVLGNGHDAKEGTRAYLEKRAPVFRNFEGPLPGWLRAEEGKGVLAWAKAKL